MRICQGCGGVLGRDCFNEQDCICISQSMQQQDLQTDEVTTSIRNDDNPVLAEEVPTQPNKVNWLMLSEAQSGCKKFKFIHHSTSSSIQLRIGADGPVLTDIWFDYAEWENLLNFIKHLSGRHL